MPRRQTIDITIKLPVDLAQRLIALAEAEYRTLTAQATHMLIDALNTKPEQDETKRG